MDDNVSDAVLQRFFNSCNELADVVNKQLFAEDDYNGRDFYWVGNVIGGVCDFDDCDFLTPSDMVLIIENKVSYKQYAEWRDAWLDNSDKPHINLKSWLMGCRYNMIQ